MGFADIEDRTGLPESKMEESQFGLPIQISFGRILSLLIVIGYVLLGGIQGLIMLIPMALIWFPDVLGSAVGYMGHGYIDEGTPAIFVSIMGWFFLLGLPVVLFFLSKQGGN
jgi:uncharacterized membrane protein YGL010W